MKFMDVLREMLGEFSVRNAVNLLYRITSFHRIPGTSGYVGAAEFLAEWLGSHGVDVGLERFRLDGRTMFYLFKSPPGWEVRDASLRLKSPYEKVLHTFRETPTLVASYSPPGEVEGEVVYVGSGTAAARYPKRKPEEKIALAYGRPETVYRVARRAGVAGLLLFERSLRAPDAVPYKRLPVYAEDLGGRLIPALSVSKATAETLIRLAEEGERPVVSMRVEAEYREAADLPVVVAEIGDGEREVWLTAHLCHPSPGANDNGSGVVSLAEGVRALHALVERGALRRPRLRIRALWGAEYYGFLAYIKRRGGLENVVASFNLDMVGGDQSKVGGSFTLTRTPLVNFGLPTVLAETGLETLFYEGGQVRTGVSRRFTATPYMGGSDHDVTNSFGVPSVMLLGWPDRYYHSSLDRPENIDGEMLRKAAAIALSSAYFLASASGDEVKWMVRHTYHYLLRHYAEMLGDASSRGWRSVYAARAAVLPKVYDKVFSDMAALYPEARALIDQLRRKLRAVVKAAPHGGRGARRGEGVVPVRRFAGPVSMGAIRRGLKPEEQRLFESLFRRIMRTSRLAGFGWLYNATYLMDGERSAEEIYAYLIAEYGPIKRGVYKDYLALLSKAGLIELRPSS